MAMTGSFGFGSGLGKNWSGGTKREAWSSIRPPSARRMAIALAVSDALPPPTGGSIASARPARAGSAPSVTTVVEECSITRSNTAGAVVIAEEAADGLEQIAPPRVAAAHEERTARAEGLQFPRQVLDRAGLGHHALQRAVILEGRGLHLHLQFPTGKQRFPC